MTEAAATNSSPVIQERQSQALPLAIIGLLFFSFGFVTWLNGSLIPFLKIICQLSTIEALLVTFVFYIAYAVMALPMSGILAKVGYRNGMALGLAVMVVGALIHIPAAYNASFAIFLVGLFALGTGLTILQTASNPYLVLLGPPESAAVRISIMGLVNKGAGVIVPLLFASLVLSDLGDPQALAQSTATPEARAALAERLVVPYIAIAVVLTALIALVRFAPLPHVEPEATDDSDGSIFHYPHLLLGAATLFLYMGLEVMAGDTIGLFGAALGVPGFATLTSFTMGWMVLGYAVGIALIPRVISQRQALVGSGVAGLLVTAGVLLSDPGSSAVSQAVWGWSGLPALPDPVFFVALMGLAHALVWPCVWPLALGGLGKHTPRASAVLIMAIAGGAIMPMAFGWIEGITGVQAAYAVALPCYAMILFYGWRGCQVGRSRD